MNSPRSKYLKVENFQIVVTLVGGMRFVNMRQGNYIIIISVVVQLSAITEQPLSVTTQHPEASGGSSANPDVWLRLIGCRFNSISDCSATDKGNSLIESC
jgi:hypothetical protein